MGQWGRPGEEHTRERYNPSRGGSKKDGMGSPCYVYHEARGDISTQGERGSRGCAWRRATIWGRGVPVGSVIDGNGQGVARLRGSPRGCIREVSKL